MNEGSSPLQLNAPRLGLGLMMAVWALSMGLLAMDWLAGKWMSWPSEWLIGIWGCFPVVVYALNRFSLSSVRVERATPPAWLHAGQVAHAQVVIQNAVGRLRNGVELAIEDQRVAVADVRAEATVQLPEAPRGLHAWPRLVVRSSFPFGFFLLARETQSIGTSWVYPALEPRAPAWPANAVAHPNPARSGEDVVAVRDYVVGDPMRLVDWKASARKGGWVVKEFEKERLPSLIFSWEQVEALGLEKGLERLAAWVARAQKQGLRYGLALGSVGVAQDNSSAHYHACMQELAAFNGGLDG